MIVLSWLQKELMDLKTFVQNRIAKIQDLSFVRQWRHVPSNQNPADLISRGVDPDKLLNQELRWNGPEFLSGSDYPNKTVNISKNNDVYNQELKNSVREKLENEVPVLNICVDDFVNNLRNISNNYLTILRILSYIFSFVNNVRRKIKASGPLTVDELEKAEIFLKKCTKSRIFSRY
ncbi:uncharacterized protein TNCV_3123411 [Trichonephila clavipes]|nr:uncharacterized protein TNCV_3123411 [Trichonephila clavipes]